MTIDKQALRQTAEKAQEHGAFNMDIHSQTVLALLDELEAAQKRVAELENDEVRQRLANAEHQLHMAELAKHNLKASRKAQFRKRLAAEKRIADLEAREVVIPQRYSMLHRVDFDEPYHTEMVYKQHQVLEALHDAGVNVAAAGKGETS